MLGCMPSHGIDLVILLLIKHPNLKEFDVHLENPSIQHFLMVSDTESSIPCNDKLVCEQN